MRQKTASQPLQHRSKSAAVRAATAALLGLAASGAWADSVSLTGGFSSYEGPLEQASVNLRDYTTTFDADGLVISAPPTGSIPGSEFLYSQYGIGQGTVALGNASSVDFYFESPTTTIARNNITFTANQAADVQVGDTFKLGSFSFANGGWLGGFPDSTFQFDLQTHSANPLLDGHAFSGLITFHVTTGLSADGSYYSTAPNDNADFFYFDFRQWAGTDPLVTPGFVGVFEAEPELQPAGGSNHGTVDLYGRIGSLIPEYLANPSGVFLATEIPIAGAVPEPATWLQLALGCAGLAGLGMRRRAGPSRQA